jgi:hypothetical protein
MLFSATKGKKRFSCSKNWWKQTIERRGTTRNSTEKEGRRRGCQEMEVTLRWNWTLSFASRGCGCFVGGLGPFYNAALSQIVSAFLCKHDMTPLVTKYVLNGFVIWNTSEHIMERWF